MKLKGFKIDGTVYFVTEEKIAEHGSLEKAAKALKCLPEKLTSKKKTEKLEPVNEISSATDIETANN